MSTSTESIPLNYAEELREIRAGFEAVADSHLHILELALADMRAGRTEAAIDFLQTVLASRGVAPMGVTYQ